MKSHIWRSLSFIGFATLIQAGPVLGDGIRFSTTIPADLMDPAAPLSAAALRGRGPSVGTGFSEKFCAMAVTSLRLPEPNASATFFSAESLLEVGTA